MAKRDYYEVLGIAKGASDQDIKRAYRKMAKQYHPDVNKEADAESKFKEINEAYEVLSDPQKKSTYEQFGHAGMEGANGFGGGGYSGGYDDLNDIFGSFFGGGFSGGSSRSSNGPRKGQDRYMQMRISFMDAVFGKTETIKLSVDETCHTCSGSGAYSKDDIKVCNTCKGSGKVTTQQRTPFGVFQSQGVCPECHGKGKTVTRKCNTCHGAGYEHKTVSLDVKIPAGIQTGQQIRVTGKGDLGANGGLNGDLYIEITVNRHDFFKRDGRNIYINVPISAVDATIGTTIDVPTVYGDVELNIAAGTQPNQQFRLRGKGVKDTRNNEPGDQFVEIEVQIPKKVSKEELHLYQQLKELNSNGKESVFDKFKKAFK